jgi:hypothetical protein
MSGCRFIASETFLEELQRANGELSAIICGAPCQEGSSYCPRHHAMCWRAAGPRSVRSAPIAPSMREAREQQRAFHLRHARAAAE